MFLHIVWFYDDLLKNQYVFDASEVSFADNFVFCIPKDCYFVNLEFFFAPNVQFYSYVCLVNSWALNVTVFIENNARKMQNLDSVT